MAADSRTLTDADSSTVGAIDIGKNAEESHDVLLRVGPGGLRRQRFAGRVPSRIYRGLVDAEESLEIEDLDI